MKLRTKIGLAIVMLLGSLLLNSCKDSGSPESITELFLISMNRLDYTTMNTISTKTTRDFIKILQKQGGDKFTEEFLENRANNFKVKITGTIPENDSVVWVSFSTDPQIMPVDKIKLRKVVEKLDKVSWKVDFSTLDYFENAAANGSIDSVRTSVDGQIHLDADSVAAPE